MRIFHFFTPFLCLIYNITPEWKKTPRLISFFARNGIHVGAFLTKEIPDKKYRTALSGGAGDTELTYAAGCAVFEELLEQGLLEHIEETGRYLESRLNALKNQFPVIQHISCKGLAVSIEISDSDLYSELLAHMKENGLLVGSGSYNKIVFRPPYVIEKRHVDYILEIIENFFNV